MTAAATQLEKSFDRIGEAIRADHSPARVEPGQELVAEVDAIEAPVLTLGDLIRAGSAHTVKVRNWGGDAEACALSAAAIAADALGIVPAKK